MVFSIFLYSSCVPYMWLYASVYVAANFWSDKTILLRCYKKPTAYDETLAVLTNSLMPYGVLIHLLFAIWAYGALPGHEIKIELIDQLGFGDYFKRRLLKMQALPILILLSCFLLGARS